MTIFNIARAFQQKRDRKWSVLYWCIDLHDCIIPGTYTRENEGRRLYPGAEEVLKHLSVRSDMRIILWSSSHKDSVNEIMTWLFDEHGILIDYFNENPEVKTDCLCNFGRKFYFNVLLDDKAGFDGKTDWFLIKYELERINEWKN